MFAPEKYLVWKILSNVFVSLYRSGVCVFVCVCVGGGNADTEIEQERDQNT